MANKSRNSKTPEDAKGILDFDAETGYLNHKIYDF